MRLVVQTAGEMLVGHVDALPLSDTVTLTDAWQVEFVFEPPYSADKHFPTFMELAALGPNEYCAFVGPVERMTDKSTRWAVMSARAIAAMDAAIGKEPTP